MNSSKSSFIKLALDSGVLKFGNYLLKSGRRSPYFFNAGLFYQGHALKSLGQFYAQTFVETGIQAQQLFGPAYKGLPLTTTTAIALAELGIEVSVTFNRKEIKDHGEGGVLIGAPLTGKTVIIDDVITAGTAFREAQSLIAKHGGVLTGVLIALDRCERGNHNLSTLEEIRGQGITVSSIINFFDLLEYLKKVNNIEQIHAMENYFEQYGVK